MNWQPFSTAPKDGPPILGWWNPYCFEAIVFQGGEWVFATDETSMSGYPPPSFWARVVPPVVTS